MSQLPVFVRESGKGLLISVYAQPKASRSEIVGRHENALKIKVQAPPADGQANAALIALLAKTLKVPKSDLAVVKGESSRQKTILYSGSQTTSVLDLLRRWA